MAENLTGTHGNDTLIGTNNGETISGLGGNDRIVANGGNDILIGGLGADRLTGGLGKVVFDFNSINNSTPRQSGMVNNASFSPIAGQGLRDIITDFTRGQDKIDLSTIDVNTNVGGNQAFVWRGTGSFTGARQTYRKALQSRWHRQRQDDHLWRHQWRSPCRLPDRAHRHQAAGRPSDFIV